MKIVLLVAALYAEDRLATPLGLDAFVPVPEANPLTREKAALGKQLFHDKRLSRDGTISCASCHDPSRAFSDDKPLAQGVGGQKGSRRTPRIANRAYGNSFFWDGRAKTLEEQVIQPIANPKEMDLDPAEAARRAGLELSVLRAALATYVRTIMSGDSAYDRYVLNGGQGLTDRQKAGLRLFRGKAGCAACHVGANFTDEKFHNTGAGDFLDYGRFDITQLSSDKGAFKTPSLRDVARTPPYMHDGSIATLKEVIDFYDKGGKKNDALDSEVRPLNLTTAEKAAILSFLSALNGVIRDGM